MRRVLRWIRHALAALSLALGIAAAALWIRGRYVGDDVLINHVRGGPPWKAVMVQGWSSAGGFRIVVEFRTTTRRVASTYLPIPPDWTPFGRLGWFTSYCTYYSSYYPRDEFAADARNFGGFQWVSHARSSAEGSETQYSLTLPAWSAVLAFTILPAWSFVTIIRRRRAAALARKGVHLCVTCGYDLRASSERCPECGTRVPAREPPGAALT